MTGRSRWLLVALAASVAAITVTAVIAGDPIIGNGVGIIEALL